MTSSPHHIITRRKALLSAAALGTSAAIQAPFILKASAADPLRIGMIFAKTGSLAEVGGDLAQGATYQLETAGSKLLGQPVELVWLDEADPQSAQQNAQKLVDSKVVALFGGSGSATGLAIESVAKRTKTPYFAVNPAAREVTGANCDRYTFRLSATIPAFCRALAPELESMGKKWYVLTASYAFGEDITRTISDISHQIGGTLVGQDQTPMGTADYSSFILKIRQAKPDVIVLGVPAGDLTNFIKQFNDFGMKGQIPIAIPVASDPDIWAAGPNAVSGIIAGKQWYFNDPNNPADEKAFAAAYMTKYNQAASDKAWLGWYGMKMLLKGIENAGSTDPGKIVTALEQITLPDGALTASIRPWDHQVLHRLLVAKTKAVITDKWDYFDIVSQIPTNNAGMDAVFGSKEEIACHMDAL